MWKHAKANPTHIPVNSLAAKRTSTARGPDGLYDGCRPVTTQQLAELFGVEPYLIIPVLYRAEVRGMICNYQCRGWIPVS